MRIHIEIVTEGQPGRQPIATVERLVEQAACDGIGLSLEEVKGLIGQLQTIVSAEHARKTVAANSPCGAWPRRSMSGASTFFDTQPLNLPERPHEQANHVLEIDGAYIRAVADKCDGRNSFGIITSRLIKPDGPGAWNAYVNEQTLSPLSRLHHFLHRQDVELRTPVAIISDGGEDVAYPTYLPWRPVQRILDWSHIAVRFCRLTYGLVSK